MKMRIIEKDCKGTQFAVWIDKKEKLWLETYAEMKKHYGEDATLLLINPDTYFGYDIQTGKAVALEFKELSQYD